MKLFKIGEDENNSSSSLSAGAAAVVAAIVAPKASNLAQEDLVLSPELSIHDAINEGVDGATQIGQERVRQVNLSWYCGFSAPGVHVVHDRDRKPTTCEAKQNCY